MERVRLSLWDTHHQSSFLEMLLFVLVITYVHLLTLHADGSIFTKDTVVVCSVTHLMIS